MNSRWYSMMYAWCVGKWQLIISKTKLKIMWNWRNARKHPAGVLSYSWLLRKAFIRQVPESYFWFPRAEVWTHIRGRFDIVLYIEHGCDSGDMWEQYYTTLENNFDRCNHLLGHRPTILFGTVQPKRKGGLILRIELSPRWRYRSSPFLG